MATATPNDWADSLAQLRSSYLHLLKLSLTDLIHTVTASVGAEGNVAINFVGERHPRLVGHDWPAWAETMVGLKRLENVQACIERVLADRVPGDLIETGVWRGGTTIFMRGVLRAYGVTDRDVYVADSFQGLPPPDLEKYPQDRKMSLHEYSFLAVGLEQVRQNFARYGLLDDHVKFVQGFFRDTLPRLRDRRWSVVRLDGDMYESTMDGLVNLYPNLAVGGFLLLDDYYHLPEAKQATDDYRARYNIKEEIVRIDDYSAFWRKTNAVSGENAQ